MTDTADKALLERLARMALANIGREYPNHIQHLMDGDGDARPPRELHPVFSGAYDWHSAVHNYWLLVRFLRLHPDGPCAAEALALIARRFNRADVAVECRYFDDARRASWERPYGLTWLLQLAAELKEWDSAEARDWGTILAPLEQLARERFHVWLPKLFYPIRSGEHSQTAFAFGLAHDWARVVGDATMAELLRAKSVEFHLRDVQAPLAYEPGAQDFLSPVLAEADLMRRVLPPAEFPRWLTAFLPQIPPRGDSSWLAPAVSRDPSDPKLAHLDGLNLSRAWMLQGIAAALPAADGRRASLSAVAELHASTGLAAICEERYEGSHWLPSFAVYLLTRRGLA
ncbi:MAG TPA: DUF2891 domain-containing protein [Gammaproteobacteria bacterium]|nr:DUF2891 domain-containing protein [Gammaproteobacteria bacterium]